MQKYKILWTEKEFAIKLRSPSGRRTQDVLRGKLDMGVEDVHGMTWLIEDKSTAYSVDKRIDTIDLDEQMDFYFLACTYNPTILPNFAGIVYNVIRKKAPTIPRMLQRPAGTLSRAKDIDTTYEIYMDTIKYYGLNPDDYIDILNLLKEKGDTFYGRTIVNRSQEKIADISKSLFYTIKKIKDNIKLFENIQDMNVFHKSPSLMCPRDCSYCEMCIMHSKGADWVDYANQSFELYDSTTPELEGTELAF
jgi:hypothetical protein